ncbi:uncharacterized protein EDB93DRAFT_701376 [Suillus bovinus]|uniref:uncharacterized protein n=1 Tax=Suillus bovinus TaxID=48563 RepID=UPI001B862BFE|nr:uncharacterized protein EDB93DRAFT_701376 [Suillus bovinus]KAG2139138.1 hypothetical protein EDB93DRAFT_701376 [Suillus bovinus]
MILRTSGRLLAFMCWTSSFESRLAWSHLQMNDTSAMPTDCHLLHEIRVISGCWAREAATIAPGIRAAGRKINAVRAVRVRYYPC